MTGTELRTTYVTLNEAGKTEVISGVCPNPFKQSRGSIFARCSSADTRELAVCSRLSGQQAIKAND